MTEDEMHELFKPYATNDKYDALIERLKSLNIFLKQLYADYGVATEAVNAIDELQGRANMAEENLRRCSHHHDVAEAEIVKLREALAKAADALADYPLDEEKARAALGERTHAVTRCALCGGDIHSLTEKAAIERGFIVPPNDTSDETL